VTLSRALRMSVVLHVLIWPVLFILNDLTNLVYWKYMNSSHEWFLLLKLTVMWVLLDIIYSFDLAIVCRLSYVSFSSSIEICHLNSVCSCLQRKCCYLGYGTLLEPDSTDRDNNNKAHYYQSWVRVLLSLNPTISREFLAPKWTSGRHKAIEAFGPL